MLRGRRGSKSGQGEVEEVESSKMAEAVNRNRMFFAELPRDWTKTIELDSVSGESNEDTPGFRREPRTSLTT